MTPPSNNNGQPLHLLSSATFALLLLILTSAAPAASGGGYGGYSKPPNEHDKGNSVSTPIAIQGVIYCRSSSGGKLIPLRGAFARIACLAVDKRGFETAPFSILSRPTDSNGYFLATLSPSEVEDNWKLKECKAFLQSSPDPKCAFPTDVNRGISGARLPTKYTSTLNNNNSKTRLYTVGPFEYLMAVIN